jgi:hypothetical protein
LLVILFLVAVHVFVLLETIALISVYVVSCDNQFFSVVVVVVVVVVVAVHVFCLIIDPLWLVPSGSPRDIQNI